ncbi:MAG: sigma-54 dependent transcriptional regulator [Thermodesulfovibrionales bacterium]|nr:sigma-54 dependent transcriptional regulator [Thermodesulfovibrionales bacterium]
MANETVLVVDDESAIRDTLADIISDEGYSVITASTGQEALNIIQENPPDIILLDIWLNDMDGLEMLPLITQKNTESIVIMISGHGNIETAVKAIKFGAYDFLEKPLSIDKVILTLNRALERRRLERENKHLKSTILTSSTLIGNSPPMQRVKQQIELASKSNSRVLILGESGTGKEIVARLLHEKSNRASFPFIEVNCAAIPHELIESELFGHEKGAFTGASERKIGKFELAHRGTLFLDEIGDMSLQTQAKVLRVIETQFFQRVGGNKNISVEVRIISATNKDLQEEVRKQKFREDLFFRLNVIPIQIPPLRERREDIPDLINHFMRKYQLESAVKPKTFTKEVINLFKQYDWPGNVRELRNAVERIMIMTQSDVISNEHIENLGLFGNNLAVRDDSLFGYKTLKEARDAFECEFIKKKLIENHWNISRTADSIDIERSNLHKKIKAYNITIQD